MFNISSFLEKFSKNIESTEINKQQIIGIIEKNTQIKVLPEEIEIKDYIVYISSSPAVKNKLFVYKEKIINDINSILTIKIIDIK